jgi:hypothetical protein
LEKDRTVVRGRALVKGKWLRVIYPASAVIERASHVTRVTPLATSPGRHVTRVTPINRLKRTRGPRNRIDAARLLADIRQHRASGEARLSEPDEPADPSVAARIALAYERQTRH